MQPSMVLACCHVHVCIGIGQIHWKTQCFRSVHAPRLSASTTFIGKGTGCREWWWFLHQCVERCFVKFCWNDNPDYEKVQPSMVSAGSMFMYELGICENRVPCSCTSLEYAKTIGKHCVFVACMHHARCREWCCF